MKIMTISGNHPRHLYYLNSIAKEFPISGTILVGRENILPLPPKGIEEIDRLNFIKHFENREKAENKYFGEQNLPSAEILKVSDDLNSKKSVEFVKKIKPDLVLIFGSGLVKDPLYSVLPKNTINMHLGLSPRYRGAATLFWPFYMLEPHWAGATFHHIISEPDAGEIIHQTTPKLSRGDKIHDVACKTVIAATKDMIKILKIVHSGKELKTYKQKSSGKNFLGKEFRPEHLRVIYTQFEDKIVDLYLDKKIGRKRKPKLIRQFN